MSTRERDDKLEGQIIHCVSLYNSTPHHFSLYGVFKLIHFHKIIMHALRRASWIDENLWVVFCYRNRILDVVYLKRSVLIFFFAKEDPDVTESEENEDASEHILKSWPEAML